MKLNARTAHKHINTHNVTINQTRNAQNSNGGHGAAYKGCPVYHKYANKINNVNNSRKQTDKTETPTTKLTTKNNLNNIAKELRPPQRQQNLNKKQNQTAIYQIIVQYILYYNIVYIYTSTNVKVTVGVTSATVTVTLSVTSVTVTVTLSVTSAAVSHPYSRSTDGHSHRQCHLHDGHSHP